MGRMQVIYVTGYGRSGSTMLDIALGQHPEIFGAGEIATMCRHVWVNDEYCACRKRIQSCDVWAPIMHQWMADGGDISAYVALQKKIEPLISFDRMRRSAALSDYIQLTEKFFQVIAEKTGKSTIVDSSKMPGRGLALTQLNEIDLSVIHLVRDARGVSHSMAKPIPLDVKSGVQKKIAGKAHVRTALRWRVYNSVAEALLKKVGPERGVTVRYEDLTLKPYEEMKRIGAVAHVNLDSIGEQLDKQEPLRSGHQMAGGRVRMSENPVWKFNATWTDDMAPAAQNRVRRITWDQLRRYGYDV